MTLPSSVVVLRAHADVGRCVKMFLWSVVPDLQRAARCRTFLVRGNGVAVVF